jgi:hypothetical protein
MATEKRDMKKAGKAAKDKGSRGERLLSAFLNSFGLHTHRGYVHCGQSDLVDLLGVHVECKFVERLNVRQAMEQAIRESEKRKDGMPAVFWKVSRKPWLTIMLTEDWVKLYKMARGKNHDTMRNDPASHEDARQYNDNGSVHTVRSNQAFRSDMGTTEES